MPEMTGPKMDIEKEEPSKETELLVKEFEIYEEIFSSC